MKTSIHFDHVACPSCKFPMHSANRDAKVHTSMCINEGCQLYGKPFETPRIRVELRPVKAGKAGRV